MRLIQADLFFLTYDEPKKEQHWQHCAALYPQARRIDGVKGFDQAIKTCARASTSEHFWVIDGDNWIYPGLDKLCWPEVERSQDYILSFGAVNSINGLVYGNGGVKLWSRSLALKMQTHECSQGGPSQVDFCLVLPYFIMPQTMSQTIIHSSARQAFRAGFREAVKLACQEHLMDWLKIWMSVGIEIENGEYCILGAQLGFLEQRRNPHLVGAIHDYAVIDHFFDSLSQTVEFPVQEVSDFLGMPLSVLTQDESQAFKQTLKTTRKMGPLHES